MILLEMSGQPWQPEFLAHPGKMPLGRMPALKTPERDLIPDSWHIQSHLEKLGADFNADLSDDDKSHSHALMRMAEGNLSPGMAHDRWLRDDCWPHIRAAFFAEVPALMRKPIAAMIRLKVRKALTANGIAQFSEADRLARLAQDLNAIEITLGDKPFLFADHPTAADAAITPILDMIRTLPCETGLRQLIRDNTALMGYIARMRDTVYPK